MGGGGNTSLQYNAPADVGAHGTELPEIGDHRMRAEWRVERWEERLGVTEHGIAVAAARHEIVGRYPIDFILVERRLADLDRQDAVTGGAARVRLDRQSGDLRKSAAGSWQLRKPVLERA